MSRLRPRGGSVLHLLNAILKGLLEGFTEFLPISSTGHLILVRGLLPLGSDPADAKRLDDLFDIVVQFPAVLAIVVLYRRRLWASAAALRARPEARRFWFGLLIAFVPAAVFGKLFHDRIEELLFAPLPVALALIAGGVVLILVDREAPAAAQAAGSAGSRFASAEAVPWHVALQIGLFQCLALIPGTSRSGATIIGGRLLGLSREAAAEYSFFLALPTMGAAFAYKFYKSCGQIRWADDGPVLLAGSAASFVTAWIVVALFVRFVQRHSLAVFGWYRIALGTAVLLWAWHTGFTGPL